MIRSSFFNAPSTEAVETTDLECPTCAIGTAKATATDDIGEVVVDPRVLTLVAPPLQLQSYGPQ